MYLETGRSSFRPWMCVLRRIFKGILLENKKEVIDMVFFEYDAEAEKRVIYKDGVEEGE